MSAVSSVLRIACRNRSCLQSSIQQQQCHGIIRRTLARHSRQRRFATVAKAAIAADNQHNGSSAATAAALLLAAAAATLQLPQGSSTTTSTKTQNEPRRVPSRISTTLTPRASNLSRFRSITDRGMNSKYTVDWNVVLGEGAYGSVHPARLAATGEKVSQWERRK